MDENVYLKRRARRMGIALVLLILVAIPPTVLFLAFGLPVIGNWVVLSLALDHGCRVNAAAAHPCAVYGVDMGDTVYGYLVSSLIGGFANPVLLLGVVDKFIPFWVIFYGTQLWCVATVAAVLVRRDALKRLRSSATVPDAQRSA